MSYINQSILPLLLMVLLAFGACEREYQCRTDFFTDPERCESFDNRMYPNDTVPENSLAYYKATVEGRPTAMSDAVPGIWYFGRVFNHTRTVDPVLNPSNPDNESVQLLGFRYAMWDLIYFKNTSPVFISFRSNNFNLEEIPDPVAYFDTLLAPGVKPVSVTDDGKGWDIRLSVYDRITSTEKLTSLSSAQFSTSAAFKPSDFNRLEITHMEKEDLGDILRYHIRLSFQAEIYQDAKGVLPAEGKFFTRIEDGEARFYLDISK